MTGEEARRLVRSIPGMDLEADFSHVYVKERDEIRTPKQLKAFARRWNMVWKIQWASYPGLTRCEYQVSTGRFNAKKVLRCVRKNTGQEGKGCVHIHREQECPAHHIMVPYLFLKLLEITTAYRVPEGIAIIQLQRNLFPDIAGDDPELFYRG